MVPIEAAISSGLPSQGVEPEIPGYILEGAELDEFLAVNSLEPTEFLGATLPIPLAPPTPSLLPLPHYPSPPPISILEEDFVPLLPPMPP